MRTVEGKAVLKDFEEVRKRYATVFRESGNGLKGTVRKRFVFATAQAEQRSLWFDTAVHPVQGRYPFRLPGPSEGSGRSCPPRSATGAARRLVLASAARLRLPQR